MTRVFLDGELQTRLVSFDLEAQTVTRHFLDGSGHFQMTPDRKGKAIETVRGVVRVGEDLGVPAASQPSLSHCYAAEPVPVSGKAGIANARRK